MNASSSKLLALVFAIIGATACSGVGDFSVTRETSEIIVEGSPNLLGDLLPAEVLPPLEVDFDLQSELEKQNADGASAVYLTALNLRITPTAMPEGDEDDFDFLNRIEFYVESAESGSSLEKKLIASMDPIPDGKVELELETRDEVNLKPYAQEGLLLTTRGAGEQPGDDVSILGEITLRIDVF